MSESSKTDLKPGIYVGAAVSMLLLLLPYVNLIFVPAYVLGPLAGVWFELRRRQQRLDLAQGAEVGFYSAFYGTVAAIAVSHVAEHFFHEQLWRFENIFRLLPLLANKGLDTDTPNAWYLWIVEIVIIVVFAGAIAAPSGMLGVKLLRRSAQS